MFFTIVAFLLTGPATVFVSASGPPPPPPPTASDVALFFVISPSVFLVLSFVLFNAVFPVLGEEKSLLRIVDRTEPIVVFVVVNLPSCAVIVEDEPSSPSRCCCCCGGGNAFSFFFLLSLAAVLLLLF